MMRFFGTFLDHVMRPDGRMGLALVEGESVEQPAELTGRNNEGRLIPRPLRPAELAPFQAAIVKPETIMVPLENLEFIALPIAEDEQCRGKWIQSKTDLHHRREPVDRFSHVRSAARQVYAPR